METVCLVVNSRILYNLLKPEGVNNVEPSHFGRLKKDPLSAVSRAETMCPYGPSIQASRNVLQVLNDRLRPS